LEGEFDSFHRLRVGAHRFVYRFHEDRIEVFFAEQRRLVYDVLAAHIAQLFKSERS
jgi:mRNA-degrading endonuclease RelE of RelBE toxin-antitoxin system